MAITTDIHKLYPESDVAFKTRCYTGRMSFISILYNVLLDALFPISDTEKDLLSMNPVDALRTLPPAPDYSGLAFDLPGTRSVFAYKDARVSRLIWLIKEKSSREAVEIAGYALWSMLREMGVSGQEAVPHRRASGPAGPALCSPLEQALEAPQCRFGTLPAQTLLLPMPITTRRRHQRGYNQCELLTNEIDRLRSRADQSLFTCENNLLTRVDRNSEQKKKNRAERVRTSHDLFDVNEEVASRFDRNTPIVVIDDVITTGGTMYQAIETLKKADFKNVRGMSVAH